MIVAIRHRGGVHTYHGTTLAGIIRDHFGPDAHVGQRPNAVNERSIVLPRGTDHVVVGSIVGRSA